MQRRKTLKSHSALDASFPPAKADPEKTAATVDHGSTATQPTKTQKSHITDYKVFSERLDILAMKCRRTYDNKTS